LDDATRLTALKTNWQCLEGLFGHWGYLYSNSSQRSMDHYWFKAKHLSLNISMGHASAKLDKDNPIRAAICETVTEVLTGGLGDNWS
jgi:hypothetical protein